MTTGRRPTLAVMVKEPRPGRVKTRLGRDIGMIDATWWARRQTLALLRRLDDPRWRLVLAVAPDRALASRAWPAGIARVAQGRGDLGARMLRVFRSMPPGPAVIIGGDIPAIASVHVAEAFAALGGAPAVVGPATDGGYWAVGLRHPQRPPAGLFDGVRWSTETALADTLPSLPRPVALIATLSDVDTAADL